MKVYDCFMFMNEFDILKKRLEYLKDKVDYFVLVESTNTHSGNHKELLFEKNKEKFKEYNIIHKVVGKLPQNYVGFAKKYGFDSLNWDREMYQRETLLIKEIKDDDIVLISDVDEIPNRDVIKSYNSTIGLHMLNFQYNFNFVQYAEPWIGTVITNGSQLKIHGPNFFRYNRWRFPILQNSGWHLSSFGDINTIMYKIKNFSHSADNGMEVFTEDFVKNVIENKECNHEKLKIRLSTSEDLKHVPVQLL